MSGAGRIIGGMSQADVDELLIQWRSEVEQSIGNVEFSLRGVIHFHDFAESYAASNPVPPGADPHTRGIVLTSLPLPGGEVYTRWPLSKVREAGDRDGFLYQWLTQAWIVMTFARWEEHWRKQFAQAMSLPMKAVQCDVMGDLRHLRNDVCHHGGVATTSNTGRCVVISDCTAGRAIYLSSEALHTVWSNLELRVDSDAR